MIRPPPERCAGGACRAAGARRTAQGTIIAVALISMLAACQPTRRPHPGTDAGGLLAVTAAAAAPAPAAGPPPAPLTLAGPAPAPATLARLRARLQPLACDDSATTTRWLRYYASPPVRLGAHLAAILPQLDFVERQLAARQLPAEFALIPLIESDYRADAIGRGGPLGMWQLMPSTARAHGAVIDANRDMRLSVLESTLAAIDHLHTLLQRFGDWRAAAMAFNAGETRIARALAASGAPPSADVRQPPGLSAITYHYLGKLQALSCLIAQPQAYGLSLPEQAPVPALAIVPVPPTVYSLTAVAAALQLDAALLRRLNGGLKHPFIPAGDARRILAPQPAPAALAALAQWTEPAPPIATHRVRSGDSPWSIARRYGLRTADLQRINGLSTQAVLRVGQVLRLGR